MIDIDNLSSKFKKMELYARRTKASYEAKVQEFTEKETAFAKLSQELETVKGSSKAAELVCPFLLIVSGTGSG